MTSGESISLALSLLADDDIVIAEGDRLCRALYRAGDRRRNLYVAGAGGQALSIALGLAMTRLERVIVFEGDGSLLMGFGGLALVGGLRPRNLYHMVLDSGCGGLGGETTISQRVDVSSVAAAAGYHWARKCYSGVYADMAVEQWLDAPGPALLDAVIDLTEPDLGPPIPLASFEIGVRFRESLQL